MGDRPDLTPDQFCAGLANSFHALPFDREAWLVKVEKMYNHLLGQSLAATGLPDHPAYIAVHKAFGEYIGLRYRDFGAPPVGFALLKRAASEPKEVRGIRLALDAMDLVDGDFAGLVRLILKADLDGHNARKLATR